jgi:hypothetical protein
MANQIVRKVEAFSFWNRDTFEMQEPLLSTYEEEEISLKFTTLMEVSLLSHTITIRE